MKSALFFLFIFFSVGVYSATMPTLISYPSGKEKNLNADKKTKVLVFLSKTCPCTQQNIPYINEISKNFPEIEFIGVHSVRNATSKDIEEIRENYKAEFPIIDDSDLKMADFLKANRTPQTFILDENNNVLYSGGVTERTNPYSAKKLYLKNALTELANNQAITEKETRSLGCIILR